VGSYKPVLLFSHYLTKEKYFKSPSDGHKICKISSFFAKVSLAFADFQIYSISTLKENEFFTPCILVFFRFTSSFI